MSPREDTPLLSGTPPPQESKHSTLFDSSLENDDTIHGDASTAQTMVNMAKACMGPGCLVLPFAARQGGLWLHTVGLLAMAVWNVYTIQRLCRCLDYIPHKKKPTAQRPSELFDLEKYRTNSIAQQRAPQMTTVQQQHPPEGTAMFGQVMWYATGPKGLWALDVLMLSFLLGILITYINAMRSFLKATPLSTHNDGLDALILVAIMGPLASVPHMGYLANASAMGLVVLALSFVVFLIYGLEQSTSTASTLSWYPQDGLWGVSHWFGCVVFSFGVAPLTYNFRSSMADPTHMVPVASYTLLGVAVANMIVGVGFWIMFPNVEGDLLEGALPPTGILSNVTRLAMVLVVLTTTPLLIAPCGELLEGKAAELLANQQSLSPQSIRILFRMGISLVGVAVSLYVPGFVDVLSFVGCCCVACLGFTIPPFLHGVLHYQFRQKSLWKLQHVVEPSKVDNNNTSALSHATSAIGGSGIGEDGNKTPLETPPQIRPDKERSYKMDMLLDILMFAWGIFATVGSTFYTFRQLSPVG